MILTKTVDPAEEPISLEQARLWCGFQTGVTEDDARLTDLIKEIRAYFEERTKHRKLITQTWTVTLDQAEAKSVIRIPLIPLVSVSSITCTDADGNTEVVDSSNYGVSPGENPRVWLASSGSWEAMRTYDTMVITCLVGYGLQADLPADLQMLMKGLVQHQYRSKGFGITETVSGQIVGIPNMFEQQIKALQVDPWG